MFSIFHHEEKSLSLLPIYVTTAGCDHKQERKERPCGAPFHHLLYVEDGEGVFETQERRHVLPKGTLLFIRKDTPITYYASDKVFQTAWVTFNGSAVTDILKYFGAESFSFINGSALYPNMLSCIKLCNRQTSAEKLSSAVYDLLTSYFTTQRETLCPPPIAKAKSFIEQNYAHDVPISEIARVAGVSQSLLFRLFKEKEQRTPIETLRDVRIRQAKLLLLSSPAYPIGEVAVLCGFSDFAYFCKIFKRETGLTPNAFRETYGV